MLDPKSEDFSSLPDLWEKQLIWMKKTPTQLFTFDSPTWRIWSPARQKVSEGLCSPLAPVGKYLLSYQLEDSPHATSSPSITVA